MPRPKRVYTDEFRERAIDLCLQAIIFGWPIPKFAKLARIPRVTVLTWMQDDAVFDRYRRAMEIKALALPTMANDIIRQVIEGKPVRRIERAEDGTIREHVDRIFLDPKAAGVVLRHIEFRIQREIKKIYEQSKTIRHETTPLREMPDNELDRKIEDFMAKAGMRKGPRDGGPSLQ